LIAPDTSLCEDHMRVSEMPVSPDVKVGFTARDDVDPGVFYDTKLTFQQEGV
jgi:hypothetical protein